MKIVYFLCAEGYAQSIGRSFKPLIEAMRKDADVEVWHVPCRGSGVRDAVRNIMFIRRHSTHHGINHITGDIHYGVLGLAGRTSVLTIHDDYPLMEKRWGVMWRFFKLYKLIFWILLPVKMATRVVCVSEATRKKISRWVRRSDMEVMPHHVMDARFRFTPRAVDKSRIRLLQVGTEENKNLETTLRVVARLNHPYHLRVIKPMTDEQRQLAAELGVDYSNAHNLTDEDIVEEYRRADIVLFPSKFEGFGMPIIEAQIVGRAVLTTDDAPMNDISGGSQCAALIADAEDEEAYLATLNRLIDDDDYRLTLIKNGTENAKRFALDAVVPRFLALYSSLRTL